MSGWRIAIFCATPMCGVLFFLKLMADSLSSTAAYLESLEVVEEKAWAERRKIAERAKREQENEKKQKEPIDRARSVSVRS